jgi:CYTH domain-containing protein
VSDEVDPMATDRPEIERVFLLDRLPDLPAGAEAVRLEQGYLPEPAGDEADDDGPVEGRVRRMTGPSLPGPICTHTVKTGLGIRRREVEARISEETFERLWPRTDGRRIRKTRHRVPHDRGSGGGADLAWELDPFDDLDLVLAEIELPSEDTPVEPPAWLAERIVREVTDDPAYRNYALAVRAGVG